jgi:hypothetical protein
MAAVRLADDANSIRSPDDTPSPVSHDGSMPDNLPRDLVTDPRINPSTAARHEAAGAA